MYPLLNQNGGSSTSVKGDRDPRTIRSRASPHPPYTPESHPSTGVGSRVDVNLRSCIRKFTRPSSLYYGRGVSRGLVFILSCKPSLWDEGGETSLETKVRKVTRDKRGWELDRLVSPFEKNSSGAWDGTGTTEVRVWGEEWGSAEPKVRIGAWGLNIKRRNRSTVNNLRSEWVSD